MPKILQIAKWESSYKWKISLYYYIYKLFNIIYEITHCIILEINSLHHNNVIYKILWCCQVRNDNKIKKSNILINWPYGLITFFQDSLVCHKL